MSRPTTAVLATTLASCVLTTDFDYDIAENITDLQTFRVSGLVEGIEDGAGAVSLKLNDGELVEATNGPFSFSAAVPNGSPFRVDLARTPAGTGCKVLDGIGTIAGADVGNVKVRCAPNVATLSALEVTPGVLAPVFVPSTLAYSFRYQVPVPPSKGASVVVKVKTSHPKAQAAVNGSAVGATGTSAPLAVGLGPKGIPVDVVAADQETKQTYNIAVDGYANDYFKASNTRADTPARFGTSVAIAGDLLVVGAPNESSASPGVDGVQSDTSMPRAGAAYVFRRANGTWKQEAYLKPKDPKRESWFGSAVAVQGDTIVVGAEHRTHSNFPLPDSPEPGAVYVFTRTSGKWTERARIDSGEGFAYEDLFGHAVALVNDTILVGAPGNWTSGKGVNPPAGNTDARGSGAVYVFRGSGASWTREAFIKASNSRSGIGTDGKLGGGDFGEALAFDGSTLVVGAPTEAGTSTGVNGDENAFSSTSSGAAYVLVRNGTTWTQQAYVKPATYVSAGDFGGSVAVQGDTIAIGSVHFSPQDEVLTPPFFYGQGAVYTLTRSGATWSQREAIPNGRKGFACSLALDGNRLFVGDCTDPSTAKNFDGDSNLKGATDAGAFVVYQRATPADPFKRAAYVKSANPVGGAYFGFALAVDGKSLAVGAAFESGIATGVNPSSTNLGAPRAGAAHVFAY